MLTKQATPLVHVSTAPHWHYSLLVALESQQLLSRLGLANSQNIQWNSTLLDGRLARTLKQRKRTARCAIRAWREHHRQ
jgi:hypothetical protein